MPQSPDIPRCPSDFAGGALYAGPHDGRGEPPAESAPLCLSTTELPQPGAPRAGPRERPVLLRCIAASPDGRQLAVGDAEGNLRVYDLEAMQLVRSS